MVKDSIFRKIQSISTNGLGSCDVYYMKPNSQEKKHYHDGIEILYVLKGSSKTHKQGRVYFYKKGEEHQVINDSKEELVLACLQIPLNYKNYLSIDLIKGRVYNILTMDIFTALADQNRRRIIELLAESGRLSASDISNKFKITSPAISQHLKVLREAKLVDMEKRAQRRIYTINTNTISEVEGWVRKMRKLWNGRLDRLDELLAAEENRGESKR